MSNRLQGQQYDEIPLYERGRFCIKTESGSVYYIEKSKDIEVSISGGNGKLRGFCRGNLIIARIGKPMVLAGIVSKADDTVTFYRTTPVVSIFRF